MIPYEQAEPLRQLSAVLLNIRLGNFDPDSTRSGYWKNSSTLAPKPKSRAASSQEDIVIPTAPQAVLSEHALSSDSSSSSGDDRSEDLSDEEVAFRCKDNEEPQAKRRAAASGPSTALAVHSRWRTLHSINPQDPEKLSCGRHITNLYKKIQERPAFEHFDCQICFGQS
jgi:hypothetical protein